MKLLQKNQRQKNLLNLMKQILKFQIQITPAISKLSEFIKEKICQSLN
ncbi:hypothetical protein D922_00024 [Enterococcus faecalis 06-MB-DW-09]|nr:hypothetical protein D922_00024 [Enterococcus faecalis 06-MB-DW-09]